MPTVFITGATGFIGQALCFKLKAMGWKVKAAFRGKCAPVCLPASVEAVSIESIETHDNYLDDLMGVDAVIHLAARVHIVNDPATDVIDAFRKVNVLGTERLARIAAKAGVKRFIFISSVKVNGEGSSWPYTENDLPEPRDAYGVSKLEAEQAVARVACETGLQTVILRLPLVYGPGAKANFKNLVKLVSSGLPLPFKSIRNRRSLIYLGNLVDAISVCVNHPLAAGETFMVSDGQDISTPDLIKAIAYAMNKKPALFSLHPRFLKALSNIFGKQEEAGKLTGTLVVDSSKIRNLLNWKPPFTLEDGLAETVAYYKKL